MDADTRNFWLGATWLVILAGVVTITIYGLIWANRYMQFDHLHNHTHAPHEHQHEHPHSLPKHEHPHIHVIQEADNNGLQDSL